MEEQASNNIKSKDNNKHIGEGSSNKSIEYKDRIKLIFFNKLISFNIIEPILEKTQIIDA